MTYLTTHEHHRLETDGFFIRRGLLSPDDLRVITRGFDDLTRMAQGLDGEVDHLGSRFVVEATEGDARIHRVVWCGGAAPELLGFGADPRLTRLAGEILGTDEVVQIIQQAHFKAPGDEVRFPWHQDAAHRRMGTPEWVDVNGRGSFVEIAIAVDPMTSQNGPLRFVPGSHRRGLLPVQPGTRVLPDGVVQPDEPISAALSPGDAVIFGPLVIHGSGPNRSDRPRRLFLNGYACPGANFRRYPGVGLGRVLPTTS